MTDVLLASEHPSERHKLRVQWERRKDAALRLPPLASGKRDPLHRNAQDAPAAPPPQRGG